MSPEAAPDTSPAPESPAALPSSESASTWPVLLPNERRILGVLVEKQKTSRTADAYPLTLERARDRLQPEKQPGPGSPTG